MVEPLQLLPTEKEIPNGAGVGKYPLCFVREWRRQLELLPGRVRWPLRGEEAARGWDKDGFHVPYNHPFILQITPSGWYRRVQAQLGMGSSSQAIISEAFQQQVARRIQPGWVEKKEKKPPSGSAVKAYLSTLPSYDWLWVGVWKLLENESLLLSFLQEWEEELLLQEEVSFVSLRANFVNTGPKKVPMLEKKTLMGWGVEEAPTFSVNITPNPPEDDEFVGEEE